MAERPIWQHRPTEQEHESLLTAMQSAGYSSVSLFVREACLRLVYADDPRPLFSALSTALRQTELAGEVLTDAIADHMEPITIEGGVEDHARGNDL